MSKGFLDDLNNRRYKSKTPEEAFDRSQAAHIKSATLQAYDQNPEVIVRRKYHDRIFELQKKQGRILPLAYRMKVFATIEKKVKGGKK